MKKWLAGLLVALAALGLGLSMANDWDFPDSDEDTSNKLEEMGGDEEHSGRYSSDEEPGLYESGTSRSSYNSGEEEEEDDDDEDDEDDDNDWENQDESLIEGGYTP
jgi:hypothetical protein